MKPRHVYTVRDRAGLDAALAALRACGVGDDEISIVARHDIELAIDPDAPTHDEHGRISGLLAGLSAVTVPTLGVSVAGAGLINLLGANIAGWIPMLAGDSANDDVRGEYRDRIERGEILLVVEASPEMHNTATAMLTAARAKLL